jgi:Ca2+-binding RTX toxin-like protein
MTATNGLQLTADLLKNMSKAGAISFSANQEVLIGSQGLDFLFQGVNLGDFDAQGRPHSGTLTTFEVAHGERIVGAFNGMSVSAADFWKDVQAGNVDALGRLVFAGDDKFDIGGSINGAPPNVFNGYTGNDLFHLNLGLHGAAAIMNGGDGDDTFQLDANFDAATDKVDGGAGFDTVFLSGGSAADLTMGSTSLVNVERIVLAPLAQPSFTYSITMSDGNVAKGATLQIDATGMLGRGSLIFNGQAESDGSFVVLGGAGFDTFVGGKGADTLNGGQGDDMLTGGGGADRFVFSGAFGHDTVKDFVATGTAHDVIQLDSAAFANFQAVQAHTAQVGADTVITLDAGDTITLQHVTAATLTAADFLFA